MKPKFVIDCADHAGFIRLANGQKNILTRANKSSELHEDYSKTGQDTQMFLIRMA